MVTLVAQETWVN